MSIIKPKNKTINNESLRKTNPKLPKLTVQQQVDNQQVIERMNRKITFTKNQRHLGRTLAFNEALDVQMLTTQSAIFSAQPNQVLFTDYQLLTTYQAQIKLINRSKLTQRIKLAPMKKKQFVIAKVKYPNQNTGDIAPGMSVTIAIRFRPSDLHDNDDELIVIIGDGVLKVPLYAKRQKCMGQWPQKIDCGHCWVGDQINKQILIKNKGGQSTYNIQSSLELHQILQIGPFTINPRILTLTKNNENNIIKVRFKPKQAGYFEENIIFKSNQGEEQQIYIKLQGGAYTASLTLDQINGHKVKQQRHQNSLYINNCEPFKLSQQSFKIHNHAVVPVDYFWHFEQNQNQIKISKQSGKIQASQILQFEVSYIPSSNAPKVIPMNLYLYNLPEQSLEKNAKVKIIDGIKSIECFQILVKSSSVESCVNVQPLHSKLTDELFVGRRKTSKFKIINESEVNRNFQVHLVKKSSQWAVFCEHFLNQQQKQDGVVKKIMISPKTSTQIEVQFEAVQLTKQTLYAYILVTFDNAPAKMISFQGEVTYPYLQLFTNHIDFGLIRTDSQFRKKLRIFNPGQNPVNFRINNENRFYNLDFYDLYEFQNEQFYLDRLKVVSDQNKQCRQWVQVPSKQFIEIQFQLFTCKEQSIELQVQIQIQSGPNYHVKVTGEVQSIQGNISRQSINLKQIYKGNTYNSNKFLSRQFAILNSGNLDFTYQIFQETVQQCSVKFSKKKQQITAQNKQRIDILLDPIKTGSFTANYDFMFYDNIPLYAAEYSKISDIVQIVPENRKSLIFKKRLTLQSQVRGVEINYFMKDQSRAKRVRQKMEDPIGSVKLSAHSFKSGSKSHYLQADKLIYPNLEQINFYNCQINKVRQIEIIIQNDSGLTTQFEIFAQKFHTQIKEERKSRNSQGGLMKVDQQAFTSQMGKTYLQARVLDKAQKVHLSNNKGISIMCEPSYGQLHKKQQQTIMVTMFNDTSGKFKDNLIIKVKDHQIKKFPINMQIKGTPVSLSRNQLGINFNEQTPVLNTGTFIVNNGKTTRNIKIINNGPKQVELQWIFYQYGQTSLSNNFFNISFSEAQPGSGNIVQTKWQSIKPQICSDSPFQISPRERIIKGRQEVTFVLTVKDCSQIGKFNNLLVGEPKMIEGEIKRQMQCLAVILQGQSVKPKLKLDQKHSNHIQKFQRFAQVGKQQRTKANNHHRKIKLKNQYRSNISFSIQVSTNNSQKNNFIISSTETDSPMNKLMAPPSGKTLNSSVGMSKLRSIRPSSKYGGSIIQKSFQNQFTLPYQSFVEIGIDLVAHAQDKEEWPLEQKIRKDGSLKIKYSNGDIQQIKLVGWLYRPFISIEMPNNILYSNQNKVIDFGTVHVKNSKKIGIFITNPSKSAANWSIYYVTYQLSKPFVFQKQLWTDEDYEDEAITDQKKCFRLSQDSGHILAESIPIHYMPATLALNGEDDNFAKQHKPTRIDFLFKPEKNLLYKSKFILSIQNGISYPIIVRGRGTYQEQKQIR